METLKLSEIEQQLYAELFTACDAENVGKISRAKAYDLFVGADLAPELINQIVELCGAKRLGYFGRSQFYVALKLIAAAQSRLPLTADSFNSGYDIPLPNFNKMSESEKRRSQQNNALYSSILNSSSIDHDLIQLQERNSQQHQMVNLPPPPKRANSLQRPTSLFTEMRQPSDDSGESSPTEAPTPVQLSTLNNVNCQGAPQLWDPCDENRQLLGTEEESSDRHSSDDEIDIWTISDEQREYYTNQFKLMQSDLTGLLSGSVAKDFFERSKLPVQELSLIWQLSDVNKDGALSLEEFYTAMHLVVLRTNHIELPPVLPPSLVPKMDGHFAQVPPDSLNESPVEPNKEDPKILHPVAVRASPDSQVLLDERELTESSSYEALNEQMKSPTKRLSMSESLEFKTGNLAQSAIQRPIPRKPSMPGPGAIPPPPPVQQVTGAGDTEPNNIPFVPNAGFTATSALPQGPKKEPPPPPPPPPRPKKNHSRSASLDFNRLGAPPAVPPRVSPSTIVPKKLVCQKSVPDVVSAFADFSPLYDLTAAQRTAEALAPFKAGAFEVYKRPESNRNASSRLMSPENSEKVGDDEKVEGKSIAVVAKRTSSVDKSSVRSTIRQHREQNTMLLRLNGELNQELLEVMEERIALEIQLEHLKPFRA